jgi:type VI secretion system protein ImpL
MFSFLQRRIVVVVFGLVILALLIWFVGPYFRFGIGEPVGQPLESETSRMIAIALVVAAWLASIALKKFRAARASNQLMAAVVKPVPEAGRPSPEAAQLRERFEDAVAALKRGRSGEASLYELPWYVIIGAPGSGKTTALVNSGLKFPVEQRTGKAALRGVGGTRNCDWWFTDDAVFLDTAGRYTTQDSDADSDSAGWSEFLGLLKKYRGRRPLNGVLVTISAHELLTQGHVSREAHVAAVRKRLDELNQQLRIQIPVYVLVTKCDLVAGFNEYFDDLTAEERAQVWGTTFPYEQTVDGGAARTLPQEIDALVERLNGRVFERIQSERDVQRRTRIFGFPQQIAALRDPLAEFVSDVFATTRFDRQMLLRGVYLTSGTQEGTPIDRLLGALSRRFAVTPEAVLPGGRGKAYFIQRLLKEVVFAESGLAGVNRHVEVRKAAWQLGAYAALVTVAVVGVIVLVVSYRRNQAYLADVTTQLGQLNEEPPPGSSAPLEAVLPRLDAVRAVADGANSHRAAGTLSMRWGLYQGGTVGDAAREAYARELDGALLPGVKERIENRLRGNVPAADQLYHYLKAYLMLGQPEHFKKEQLAFIAHEEWSRETNADAATSLSDHFDFLLARGPVRPLPLDATLIAQARSTLRRESPPRLVYSQLQLGYADDPKSALRLDIASGAGAERVLRRKSGRPLSEPVLGLYTARVFNDLTGTNTEQLAKAFTADQWVWGEEGQPAMKASELVGAVREIYETDYIAFWDRILKDIDVVPLGTLERTKEVLETLAAPTSPLRGFLKVVDEHTYLVKKPDTAAPSGGLLGSAAEAAFKRGRQLITTDAPLPGARITAHFADLHRLVAGEGGSGAPIDAVIRRLEELQKKMAQLGEGVGKTPPSDAGAIAEVGAITSSLKVEAAPLPPSLATVVIKVADGAGAAVRSGVTGNLSRRYEEDVLRMCQRVTGGRYPFDATSDLDVPLADFGALFGPGGVYDEFFKTWLVPLVDTARTEWAWRRDESGQPVSGGLPLARFQEAGAIRDAFFRSGSDPEVRFGVTSIDLDRASRKFLLDIDGQTLEDVHAAERTVAMTWPGKRPGQASIAFEDLSGGRTNSAAQGAWALFRLLDTASVRPVSDVRFLVVFAKGGQRAEVQLDASSIDNPFKAQLFRQFRCS